MTLRRVSFLVILALVTCHAGRLRADSRPNILLIVSDDYGAPYYGFMLDKLKRTLPDWDPAPSIPCGPGVPAADAPCQLYVCTPNLDRLAKEGIAFERAYVTAPHCTWSHESFFTGLNRRDLAAYPGIGCTGNAGAVDGRPQTIPEALGSPTGAESRLGYNTVLKGKWWLGNEDNFFNDRTFDAVPPSDPEYKSENDKTIGETKTLRSLKKWIKAQSSDTPWFMVWAPEMPHYSYGGVEEHAPSIKHFYDHMETKNPPHITTTNFGTQATHEYFESISYFDARVGEAVRFLDQLECGSDPSTDADAPVPDYTGHWPGADSCPAPLPYESSCPNATERYAGFRSNTLIVYVADNPAGLQESKAHFTENGLRGPIIAYLPDRIPAFDQRSPRPAQYEPHPAPIGAIDIFPTILEYAGEHGLRPPGGGAEVHRQFPDARSFKAMAESVAAYDDATWRALGRRYFFSNVTSGSTGMRAVVDACPATYTEFAGATNTSVPSPSPFKLYNSTQNLALKPKRLTNLASDPFEELYAADDFFITQQNAGEDEPKYANGVAVEPALNSALATWWTCPAQAASSQSVRRSLALNACANVPVRCTDAAGDASCAATPAVAPCEAVVSTSTTCPVAP